MSLLVFEFPADLVGRIEYLKDVIKRTKDEMKKTEGKRKVEALAQIEKWEAFLDFVKPGNLRKVFKLDANDHSPGFSANTLIHQIADKTGNPIPVKDTNLIQRLTKHIYGEESHENKITFEESMIPDIYIWNEEDKEGLFLKGLVKY